MCIYKDVVYATADADNDERSLLLLLDLDMYLYELLNWKKFILICVVVSNKENNNSLKNKETECFHTSFFLGCLDIKNNQNKRKNQTN